MPRIFFFILLFVLISFISGCSIQAEEPDTITIDNYEVIENNRLFIDEIRSQKSEILNLTNKNQYLSDRYTTLKQAFDECQKNKKTSFEKYSQMKKQFVVYERETFNIILTDNKEIIDLAKNLRMNNVEGTISNIQYWVNTNIDYEFFLEAQSLKKILRTKNGDCTDKAEITYNLLWLNGIPARKVHGYSKDNEGKIERHDFLEVLYPLDNNLYWKPINGGYEKTGEGYW